MARLRLDGRQGGLIRQQKPYEWRPHGIKERGVGGTERSHVWLEHSEPEDEASR